MSPSHRATDKVADLIIRGIKPTDAIVQLAILIVSES